MKKRIISMLLTVLMVMSLFSGLTVNAHAATYNGANTIEYTMAQGDFVLRICQKLGLNYYTCKPAIMILNNIQDGQWNKLTVGRTLTLPASDYDALLISNGAGTTVYNSGAAATTATTSNVTGTATTGTATAVTTSAAAAAASADTLAYYLVPYTMSYGETVSGVCNALGVNFAIFSPFIKQVNNVTNWTKVRAGDTLIIPTPVAPAVGTTCYGVMQHIVASHDTAYGIAASKGINYSANERLLKVLNQTENLAAIKAGDKFFYPVPLTMSVPGTGNPGSTTTTTTTTTVTDGNGTTTTSTTTTAKLFKISSGMATSDGTMLFYVDNKPVTAAPAGAKVTVVTDTFDGKAIQSLTVKQSDGKADFLLSSDTFVMPACDVRVDAAVKSGYDINIEANYSGKASASVGGVSVQAAVKGATVVVKSVDPNYEISSIFVYYRKLVSSANKTEVKHSSSNAFVMPDMPVTVEVVLKPVTTYAFYVNSPDNGSFYLKVDGSPVIRAAKGAQVTLVAEPDPGYVAGYITVSKHGEPSKFVNFFNNSFTMPAFDVDVHVNFIANGDNILIMPAVGGDAVAYEASGVTIGFLSDTIIGTPTVDTLETITERGAGEWVALKAEPESGYKLDPNDPYDIVRNSDGLKVKAYPKEVGSVSYYFFKMPKGGVTVTPHFVGEASYAIWPQIYLNGDPVYKYSECSFSATINGTKTEFLESPALDTTISKMKLNAVPYGQFVDLRYDSNEGYSFLRYEVFTADKPSSGDPKGSDLTWNPDEELSNQATLHGYFDMPNKHVVVRAYFETGKTAIGNAIITGVGSVGYQIEGVTGTVSSATCEPGKKVTIVPKAGNGYKFDDDNWKDKLSVTRKDNGAPLPLTQVTLAGGGKGYEFTMPAEGVDVWAVFDPKPFVITMKCVDEVGNVFTGESLWQIAVNGVISAVDNIPGGTKVEVAYEDFIKVAMTEAGWSNYDMVSFRIDGMEYTADVLNYFYEFSMIDQWAKDLEIVAVMRPRVTNTPSVHRLIANYLPTMGDVEFFLFNTNPMTGEPSGTNYASNIDGVDYYAKVGSGKKITNARYTSYAFAGDYVALVANSNDDQYHASLENISIVPVFGEADRIVPTLWHVNSINGDTNGGKGYDLYIFRMPDDDLNISVNFTGNKYGMTIKVVDRDGNPVGGMIDMFVETSAFTDVAADSTFGSVSFNQLVTIMPSTRARAEGIGVYSVDVKTDPEDKAVYYYDNSMAGSGPVFYMPASNVIVYITVDDILANNLNVINLQHMLDGGSLVIRSGPALTDPVLLTISGTNTITMNVTEFNVGDEIYVFEVPDAGKAHLGKGDLGITNNGIVYTVANWHAEAADGTNIWKVKVPAGMMVFTAVWGDPVEAPGAENVIYAPASDIIGGTLTFKQDGKVVSTYTAGKDLTIDAAKETGYGDLTKDNIVIKDVNGNDVPFTLSGTTITIKGKNLPEGGISVSAVFPISKVSITFKLTADDSLGAKLTLNAVDQFVTDKTTGKTYDLEPGTLITISSGNPAYNAVTVESPKYGIAENKTSQNYVVPDADETVTITLTSTNPAVTVNLHTDSKYGTLGLAHTDSTAMIEQPSAFKVGDDLFFFPSAAYGYELDEDNFKVTENVSGKVHKIATSDIVETSAGSGVYKITGLAQIPDGGVTIDAAFKPQTIKVSFTFATGHKGTVQVSNGSNTATIQDDVSVEALYGAKITMTPVGDFQWGTGAASIPGKTVSGSGNTGTRTYTIDTEADFTVTLDVIEK